MTHFYTIGKNIMNTYLCEKMEWHFTNTMCSKEKEKMATYKLLYFIHVSFLILKQSLGHTYLLNK